MNLHGYVLGDPVNLVDPEGLFYFNLRESVEVFKNYMAGVYHGATFGLADGLVGINPDCMGPGFGFGTGMGTFIPGTGAVKGLQALKDLVAARRAARAIDELPPPGSWPPMPSGRYPEGWTGIKPSKARGGNSGARLRDGSGRGIRIMKGNPNAKEPVKRSPYSRTNTGNGESPHRPWPEGN